MRHPSLSRLHPQPHQPKTKSRKDMCKHSLIAKVKHDAHLHCFAQEIRAALYRRIWVYLAFAQMVLGTSIFANSGYAKIFGAIVSIIAAAMTTFKYADMAAESKAAKTALYKLCLASGTASISDEQMINRYHDIIADAPDVSPNIRGIAQVCTEMSYEGIDHSQPAPVVNLSYTQWLIVKCSGTSYILSEPNVYRPWSKDKEDKEDKTKVDKSS